MQTLTAACSVLEGRERIKIVAYDRILIRRPYRDGKGIVRVMDSCVKVIMKPAAQMFVGKEFPVDVARRAFGAG